MRVAALGGRILLLGGLSACGPQVTSVSAEGSTSADGPTDSSPTADASSTSVVEPSGTSSGGSSSGSSGAVADDDSAGLDFVPDPDAGLGAECDEFTYACPAGLKCMPYDERGAVWSDFGCFPVDPDPVGLYEPCVMQDHPYSGLDNCEAGLMCWDVDWETLEGYCIALCVGDIDAPVCEDPDTSCVVNQVFALCLPHCDPLGDDCGESEGCYPTSDTFGCAPDGSNEMFGDPGDPCEFLNACIPGAACVSMSAVPDCMSGVGCCTSLCHLEDPAPPCLPGQQCAPWYDEGAAPAGFEHVGFCALPS